MDVALEVVVLEAVSNADGTQDLILKPFENGLPQKVTSISEVAAVEAATSVDTDTAPAAGEEITYNVCRECGLICSNLDELQAHTKTHPPKKVHKCNLCGNAYSTKYILQKHKLRHSQEIQKDLQVSECTIKKKRVKGPHNCKFCGKEFKRLSLMTRHVKMHSKEWRPRCCNCSKYLKIKEENQIHERKETVQDISSSNETKVESKTSSSEQKPYCDDCKNGYIVISKIVTNDSGKGTDARLEVAQDDNKAFQTVGTSQEGHALAETKTETNIAETLNENCVLNIDGKPVCPQCGKVFSRIGNLRQHMKIHTGEKHYTCETCGKGFNRSDNLRNHMNKHKSEEAKELFSCQFCGKVFFYLPSLTRHLLTHSNIKRHKCSYCEKRFFRNSDLKKHTRTHTGEKPYECSVCGRTFSDLSTCYKHVRLHEGVNKCYKCEKCNQCFLGISKFIKHKRTCGKEIIQEPKEELVVVPVNSSDFGDHEYHLPIVDGKVQLVSSTSGTVQNHPESSVILTLQVVHSDTQPTEVIDTKSDNTEASDHIDVKVEPPVSRGRVGCGPHVCTTCGKRYSRESNLKRHLLTHSKRNPYKCDDCGESFYRQDYFKNHRLKCHSNLPYKSPSSIQAVCTVCGKSLSRGSMRIHMMGHAGIRPFTCEVCGKAYFQRHDLKRHIRTHTGEKPYKCKVCNSAFSDASTYSRHYKIHTGEKNHICSACEKAFITTSELKKHLKVCYYMKYPDKKSPPPFEDC